MRFRIGSWREEISVRKGIEMNFSFNKCRYWLSIRLVDLNTCAEDWIIPGRGKDTMLKNPGGHLENSK